MLAGQMATSDNQSVNQPSQIFKPDEYNPLRNPMHYSDAQQLERKGISLPTDKREYRDGRR